MCLTFTTIQNSCKQWPICLFKYNKNTHLCISKFYTFTVFELFQ